MQSVPFTWSQILDAANGFLGNEFVAGSLIAVCALAIAGKVAQFLKAIVEG
jgi:hypothetical protein